MNAIQLPHIAAIYIIHKLAQSAICINYIYVHFEIVYIPIKYHLSSSGGSMGFLFGISKNNVEKNMDQAQ